ncbi:unnamed protein product [Commensalibacter communis]|uniref:HindIII family type II restriction endonuclease n=1 Tax=Commensalibacter communis TaxID=2972786 RepID=UPI0022FFAB07|nr:HindIII family type II restriction endonuclease [Commensalibacter communis]CAI3939556.1 unnamed protein product [Commensalibacter communis]
MINQQLIHHRQKWIQKILNVGQNSNRLEKELQQEIQSFPNVLIDHLRLCGDIPEQYVHDSTEEKLYSKYTDTLLSLTFNELGINSVVLQTRSNSADVESCSKSNNYSFVSDAKAFRLSRTAKNQKDFKITALDVWRETHDYAMLVCPIYQLPTSQSQIYMQATTRSVCIFTYSHLAVLYRYMQISSKKKADDLLYQIFKEVKGMNPSKNSKDYWSILNRIILNFDPQIPALWNEEKREVDISIKVAKKIALDFLCDERKRILRMSHQAALQELMKMNRIDNREKTIQSIKNNDLLTL